MNNEVKTLVGGPQDGAKVTSQHLPAIIWVGPKWLGDGFAAWGRKHSERFPCCYVLNGNDGRFYFTPLPEDYRYAP